MDAISLHKDLKSIGLPEKGAAVYGYLLEVGTAFPSKIAEKTKLNRSTVYHTLNDLVARGLVSQIERGKKLCFQIEKPAQLMRFAKSQIGVAEERFARAQTLLPELEGLFALAPTKPKVRFFEGLPGILSIYTEHISQAEPYEMLGYSNVEELMRVLPKKFVADYVRAKQRLGITTRAIFPDTTFSRRYNKTIYDGVGKKYLVQSRLIPADDFPYQAEVTIYGTNKVSVINFQQQALIGVIIEDETIAGMMQMIFELAWKGTAVS